MDEDGLKEYLDIKHFGFDRARRTDHVRNLQGGVRALKEYAEAQQAASSAQGSTTGGEGVFQQWIENLKAKGIGEVTPEGALSGANFWVESGFEPTRPTLRKLYLGALEAWDELVQLREEKGQSQEKEETAKRTEQGLALHVLKLGKALTDVHDLKQQLHISQQEVETWKQRVRELGQELAESEKNECPTPERHHVDQPGVLRGLPNPDEIILDPEIVDPHHYLYEPKPHLYGPTK